MGIESVGSRNFRKLSKWEMEQMENGKNRINLISKFG